MLYAPPHGPSYYCHPLSLREGEAIRAVAQSDAAAHKYHGQVVAVNQVPAESSAQTTGVSSDVQAGLRVTRRGGAEGRLHGKAPGKWAEKNRGGLLTTGSGTLTVQRINPPLPFAFPPHIHNTHTYLAVVLRCEPHVRVLLPVVGPCAAAGKVLLSD